MKKRIICLILLTIIIIPLTGCGNKYKGYWCNYDETALVSVLLKDNITDKQKEAIESKIDTFENVSSSHYQSKEEYEEQLGANADIHSVYVVSFSSHDSIGDYIEELKTMAGVLDAVQQNAKNDISLYNLESWGKYTFTNSDEAIESDLETGKYKIKKGVITLTPSDKSKQTRILYIKNGLLCKDANCNEIFARSNSTCSGMSN